MIHNFVCIYINTSVKIIHKILLFNTSRTFNKMQKKSLKFISALIVVLVFYIFYEISSFSFKVKNRDFLTIESNNIRNPQVKKIIRYIDRIYSSLLISLMKIVKNIT